MSLDEERRQWEREALAVPLPSRIATSKEKITGVECVWFSDNNATSSTVILYAHGGGLVAGSVVTHRNFAATLTTATEAPVLLINYRLLPEHQYPAPLEDMLSVYHSLISEHEYTPEQIVLGGDSSGAGLVLAALVQLKESNSPLPRCAFSISGTFDMTLSGKSMNSSLATDPLLSFAELESWQKKYLHFDLKSPLLSALFADLSNLPPILLLAGGTERWLSDSVRVSQKICDSSGEAYLRIWDCMGHVWTMDSKLKESGEAVKQITNFIAERGSGLHSITFV